MWEEAHALAKRHMGASEVSSMYISQAQALEQQGKFREAEKLYISVQESDLAISMYKKQRHYDQMMRLVQQYHPDLVQSTHIHLAQELEQEVRPLNSKYLDQVLPPLINFPYRATIVLLKNILWMLEIGNLLYICIEG